MIKSKYNMSVDTEILKEMKIFAIQQNKDLNELLVECYINYKNKFDMIKNGDILPSVEELEIDDL